MKDLIKSETAACLVAGATSLFAITTIVLLLLFHL